MGDTLNRRLLRAKLVYAAEETCEVRWGDGRTMRYQGWNFEKTLLVEERANLARQGELVDVRLAVESDRAANVERDARVVLKKDWNVLDREVPSQVYRVRRYGGTTTFRVAFHLDLGPGVRQRVGVRYDNPAASGAAYETDLEVEGAGLGYKVETPFYAVETDARSGQLRTVTGKVAEEGGTALHRLAPAGRTQPGNVVIFAVEEGGACRAAAVTAADWDRPEVVEETRGSIFFSQTRRGRLVAPNADSRRAWPELEIAYRFFAQLPYFLVYSRLTFPEDTGVFGVYNDVVLVDRAPFSHYTFRPVSPGLPLTDVEEMGHILVDPAWTSDLPAGLAFSGFLPYDLPWHAFINMHPLREHAFTGIQLRSAMHSPGGEPVTYRPATYLLREQASLQWFRAPIYVETRDRRENVVVVPAGTVYEDLHALSPSGWDQAWGQRTDALGRQLMNPLEVSAHPVYLGEPAPAEEFEVLPFGRRADAYLRAGVR